MKTGIFFGSSGGTTQGVAQQIARQLGVETADVRDVARATADDLGAYDFLIFGTSTWGAGDLQDDWEDFLRVVAQADLSGKTVAIFGCGDSATYSDTFCDGMGKIFRAVKDRAKIVGFSATEDYVFDASEAVVDGRFVGLALDEDNESHRTAERIGRWVSTIQAALG
jgi:flavodoxin I